jgi:hypothetical protein
MELFLKEKQPIESNPLEDLKAIKKFNSSKSTSHFTERASSVDSSYSVGDRPPKPSTSTNTSLDSSEKPR